jgi:hypothetical protein
MILAAPLVLGSTASAQTDEARAAARSAATEGLKALQEGRYKEALDLCTRAETLMHAPTHLLLIARAQTKLGHLVEAQEAYIKIVRDHLAANAPRAFVEAQATAAEEQAALAPRVPSLRVDLQGATDASSVEITMDGAPYPAALVGIASPVNPGSHTLTAKSASAAADPVTVTVSEGARQNATLVLKPVATADTGEAGGTAATATADARSSGDTAPSSSHLGLRTAGWVSVGVGVAGLVVGTIFVIKNHSDRDDANKLCGAMGCPDSKRADIASFDDSANSASTLAWVGYGVGAAGVVAGATLLWLGHDKPGAQQSGRVVPWFGGRSMGVRVSF